MYQNGVSLFKRLPAFRLLLFLIIGILCQYFLLLQLNIILSVFAVSSALLCSYLLLKPANKFNFIWISGLSIGLLFMSIGALLSFVKNGKNQPQFIGNYYQPNVPVLVTLQEPLVVKSKSYKALVKAEAVLVNGKWVAVSGEILVYFRKDSLKPNLSYGNQLLISKPLVAITNAGNPGGFNYKQYCEFQGIYYQVFLDHGNYQQLTSTNAVLFDNCL